jgi:hypothetical protein
MAWSSEVPETQCAWRPFAYSGRGGPRVAQSATLGRGAQGASRRLPAEHLPRVRGLRSLHSDRSRAPARGLARRSRGGGRAFAYLRISDLLNDWTTGRFECGSRRRLSGETRLATLRSSEFKPSVIVLEFMDLAMHKRADMDAALSRRRLNG